ncbi:MAG: flavodoxin family protein [Candidatus Hodarchaeales archaeon]|jgi:flavodoxin
MRRGLIIYHSLFGNTKQVAYSLANGMKEAGMSVDCLGIEEIDFKSLSKYEFIAIGGPTHIIGISKPLKEFLAKLKSVSLKGIKGFSFDTRNPSRMNKKWLLTLENSAARRIEGKMRHMKMKIIKPYQSAIVYGREGPLENNVDFEFKSIGKELGKMLKGEEKKE